MSTFQPVFRNREYFNYKTTPAGTVLVTGIYIGTRPGRFDETKMDYLFHDDKGTEVLLNYSGHLKFLMGKVSVGDKVRVTFCGDEKCKSGKFAGKMSHQFTVEVAQNSPA